MATNSIIIGTGSYIPDQVVTNEHFLQHQFYSKGGTPIVKPASDIVRKLEQISGIRERKYIADHHDSAHMAAKAADCAITSSGLSSENIDGIILAHNFGNIPPGETQGHLIPNLAAIVKGRLGIKNRKCFAYDVLFGCPGWVEGLIIGHQYLQNGTHQNLLIIGVEVISRILDPHDMDSMLFGDGAGAAVLSSEEAETKRGILSHCTYSHCNEELDYLKMGTSLKEGCCGSLTPKMDGRKVFKYALSQIPDLVDECLAEADLDANEVKKILFHQANEKMIMSVAQQILERQGLEGNLEDLVPFMVQETGNSSVATIPTMLDFILDGRLENHQLHKDDVVVMASVGAGMHCNSLVYQF